MGDDKLIEYDNKIISDKNNKLVVANKSDMILSEAVQKPKIRIDSITLENRLLINGGLMIGKINNISFDFEYDWMNVACSLECYTETEPESICYRLINKLLNKEITHDDKKFHFNWSIEDKSATIYSHSCIDQRIYAAIKSKALKDLNLLLSTQLISNIYAPLFPSLRTAYSVFRNV